VDVGVDEAGEQVQPAGVDVLGRRKQRVGVEDIGHPPVGDGHRRPADSLCTHQLHVVQHQVVIHAAPC
jgi:hypothetical protein